MRNFLDERYWEVWTWFSKYNSNFNCMVTLTTKTTKFGFAKFLSFRNIGNQELKNIYIPAMYALCTMS